MFQLIILTLLLNLPITPMPSERLTTPGGVPGIRPIVAPHKVNWWQDSARPGEGGNVVLYGHNPGVFSTLPNIKLGAVITVTWSPSGLPSEAAEGPSQGSQGRDFAYVVTRVFIVDEDAKGAGKWIEPTPAERLTLVTCAGEDRLIVLAEMK